MIMSKTISKKIKETDAKIATGGKIKISSKTFASDITAIIAGLLGVMDGYTDFIESIRRPSDRRRKSGPGIRRYGFIDKTSDLALANQVFSPALFSAQDLKDLVRNIELIRNLLNYLQQYVRLTQDCLLVMGDDAYSMALLYYQSVRELAHRNVPGAEQVFRALEPFFRRRHTGTGEEPPTEPEVERDVRALLHGKKEGEIIIRNEADRIIKGKRTVIDATHKEKGAFKETERGEIN